MRRRSWLALLGLGIFLAATADAGEWHETRLYDCLGPVEKFADIEIALVGSAEKLGVTDEELRDYAREIFDNRLAGMRKEGLDVDSLSRDREEATKTGLLQFTLWTVRETYPVIFNIEARVGSAQCLFEGRAFYKINYLGYVPEVEIRNTTKESIREVIERIADKFFNGR